MSKSFGEYFEESMSSLGLPVPSSLFQDVTTAIATIRTIQAGVAAAGGMSSTVTIAELIGAGTVPEILAVAAAVPAAFYAGACIGACIYAAGCMGFDAIAELSSSGIDFTDASTANVDVYAYQQAGYTRYSEEGGGGQAYA